MNRSGGPAALRSARATGLKGPLAGAGPAWRAGATVSHAVGGYGSVTSASDVEVAVQDNDVQANGIYAVGEGVHLGNNFRLRYNGVILHDGRIMGISYEHESFAHSQFTGTYTADGELLSGELRGVESIVDPASFATLARNHFERRAMSGTVVEARSAGLTVTDRDGGEDRFSLHYDDVHDRPSSLSLWEGIWVVVSDGASTVSMTVDADGVFFSQHVNGCTTNGRLSAPDPDRNLYEQRYDLSSCGNLDGAYTGFAYLDPLGGSENDHALLMTTPDDGTGLAVATFYRPGAAPGGPYLEDDHGSTRDTATAVDVPSDTAGALTPNDVDYFSISLSVSGTLRVYSSGSIDTWGELEHADGSVIEIDDDSGEDSNFRIEHEVPSGLYYVRVAGNPSNTRGDYTLHMRLVDE